MTTNTLTPAQKRVLLAWPDDADRLFMAEGGAIAACKGLAKLGLVEPLAGQRRPRLFRLLVKGFELRFDLECEAK